MRYPDIVADARRLGVTREHLWRVLEGQRESPVLLERYQRLQAKKGRVA